MKSRNLIFALVLASLPSLATAAAGAGGDHHGIPWGNLVIPQIINFLIFAGLLTYYTKDIVISHFKKRAADFEEATQAAARARAEAERRYKEIEGKLATLQANGQTELKKAEADAAALRTSLIEAAKVQAGKIGVEAESIVKAEWQRAVLALRTETLAKSVSHAEEQLRTGQAESAPSLQKAFIDRVQGARA